MSLSSPLLSPSDSYPLPSRLFCCFLTYTPDPVCPTWPVTLQGGLGTVWRSDGGGERAVPRGLQGIPMSSSVSNSGGKSNEGGEESRGGVHADDEEGGPSVAPRRKEGTAVSKTRQLKSATKAVQKAVKKMHSLGGPGFLCVFLYKSGELLTSSSPCFSAWVHQEGPGGMMHAFENLPTKRVKKIPVLSSFNDAFRLLNRGEVIFLLTALG